MKFPKEYYFPTTPILHFLTWPNPHFFQYLPISISFAQEKVNYKKHGAGNELLHLKMEMPNQESTSGRSGLYSFLSMEIILVSTVLQIFNLAQNPDRNNG